MVQIYMFVYALIIFLSLFLVIINCSMSFFTTFFNYLLEDINTQYIFDHLLLTLICFYLTLQLLSPAILQLIVQNECVYIL